MGFASCCRDCSCWTVFVLSMIVLLFSLCLALSDIAAIVELQTHMDTVKGTSLLDLNCVDICRNWFTEEKELQCCDRVGSGQCTEKQICKREYMSLNNVSLQVLEEDALSESMIVVCCLAIAVSVVVVQYRRKDRVYDSHELESHISSVIGSSLREKLILQETDDAESEKPFWARGKDVKKLASLQIAKFDV